MQTRRIIQCAVAAMLAASALALAACSGSSSDKAGGADAAEPRVLTLASASEPPAALLSWAEEVKRLSGGTLRIDFENEWRRSEPYYEAGILEDVKAGKIDMGWVGSRVFDTVGVTSFQALVAPLLIDSYDLEGRVFEQGIPERMLKGVSELDVVGIGVLPGPMRKLLACPSPSCAQETSRARSSGFRIPVPGTRLCARSAPRPELCPRERSSTGSTPTSSSSAQLQETPTTWARSTSPRT